MAVVRRTLEAHVRALAGRYPVVVILGPRQSGKTTLCREVFRGKPYVSLEDPDTRQFATTDPRGFLAQYQGGAVLDEIQRTPELASYLQTAVDTDNAPGRFVLTGSENFTIAQSVSQSLAGRSAVTTLLPLALDEVRRFDDAPGDLFETLFAGGYPAIFDRQIPPGEWLANYTQTYVERDVRQILNVSDLLSFQTFLRLCAGHSGQLLNLSSLSASAGIVHNTAKAWLSVLEASYLLRRLPPWFANVNKRLVKTPKLHFYDSGLLCYLLGIHSPSEIITHPHRGAIFESWVVSEIHKAHAHRGLDARLSFYRDHKGSEVDLLVDTGKKLLAVEAKSGQTVAPDFFRAFEDFQAVPSAKITESIVLYGGGASQTRAQGQVIGWADIQRFTWTAGGLESPRRRRLIGKNAKRKRAKAPKKARKGSS